MTPNVQKVDVAVTEKYANSIQQTIAIINL